MDMNGEYRVAASRDRVWAALNDPDILRRCIPGCEEMEKVSPTEFTAKARVKVGPVNARFTGKVVLSELDPPAGYRIMGEGQGGAAGFGKGGATVRLHAESADLTRLSYTAEAHVGGKLAQIGNRLIQASAKKMADDFFAAFGEILAGRPAVSSEEAADVVATELLVEAAEEVEAMPEVPSSGAPQFASVPLVARPDSIVGDDPDAAVALADLAEPHHRVDTPDPAPVAQPENRGGLRPLVWIPLVTLALVALVVLLR